jgi:hypothetical protein
MLAAAAVPTVQWQPFQTDGTYDYKWTLAKTIQGQNPGATPSIRVQKGVKQELTYQLDYTRAIDQTTVKMTVAGGFTITNANLPPTPPVPPADPNAPTVAPTTNEITITAVTVLLKPVTGTGTPAAVTPTCTGLNAPIAPGIAGVTCTWPATAYNGFMDSGNAVATILFTDTSANPAGSPLETTSPSNYDFGNAVGRFATALLTDKVDLSAFDTLYAGFTGFQRNSIWRYTDTNQQIPDSGVPVMDSGTKT